ncbi:hypothetical protein [uncultured Mucilaginibacter sp.]|uniref:hypothetical protein n=1 Tax=uncultured Mucilaginibacter sp. TaxID=797541 RepID=UPI0025DF528D|nr:hypothetical protein [uncultured Mucilaginibacter sp.]
MRKHLVYVLLSAAMGLSSCLKGPEPDSTPAIQPQGNFAGQFTKIHRNALNNKRDTVKLNIQLKLTGNKYEVINTDERHAASNGAFEYNRQFIVWYDNTITTAANLNLPPYHLHGQFAYHFDGSNFSFSASDYADTVKYVYALKKQ